MSRETARNFYLYTVKTLIFIALFSPLVITGIFYFPFIVAKTIFFQIVVECALFFYILLLSLDHKYIPKFDAITKSITAFFGIYVLASVLGMDPARSFFGTYERMLSVVNLTHFIVFFLIVKSVFVSGRDWIMLLRVFLFASILCSLYGVAQRFGADWVYHSNIDRIDSTIGNPAYVAGYLMFALFFALMLFVRDANVFSRYFYLSSIILNLVAIYFTGTRGAVLALAVGFVMLGIVYVLKEGVSGLLKKKTALSALGVLAVMFLAVFLLAGKEGALQYTKRFTSASLSDGTVQTRILAAKSSWEGFLEHPFLGWGPENYNLIFDKYYNPKIYPTENWFDHAHNIIFDIATTMGLVGLAAYLYLLGHLVWVAHRYARLNPGQFWVGALTVVLVLSYFIQNLFVFDSLVTYLPLMLLFALAGAGFKLEESNAPENKEGRAKKFYNPSAKTAIIMLPFLAFTMYYISVRPALGAYYTVEALRSPKGDSIFATDNFTAALAYSNFGKHEIRIKLADYTVDFLYDKSNQDEEAKKKLAAYTMQEMEKTLEEAPYDFRNYLYFANFLGNASATLAKNNVNGYQKADEVLKQSQELAPNKQILYIQWAKVKFGLNDFTGAIPLLEKLVQLSPDLIDSQMKLAYAYTKTQDRDKALAIYHAALQKTGLEVQNYIDIAVGLAGNGEKKEAVLAAQKIKELDPSLMEKVEQFITSLKE